MTHRKQGGRDGLSVLAAGHALHEDVADVPQDGARGQQHQRCKYKGADGVRKRPSRVILHHVRASSVPSILHFKVCLTHCTHIPLTR